MINKTQEPKKIKIMISGRSVEVLAQKIGSHIWYQTEKGISSVEVEGAFASRKKRKSADSNSFQILAPMPGKITKVLTVEAGPAEPGQSLIVMEAMKMEYTLKSPSVRRVKKIHAKVGDQVALGQVLIDFEEESPAQSQGGERG